MTWVRNSFLALVVLVIVAYVALSVAFRQPTRTVVRIPPSDKLLLVGATIVDPRSGAVTPGMNVLMEAGRIISVEASRLSSADRSVRQVDVTGKYVTPGFNDMHAHPLGPDDPSGSLALLLANGVTGFRQMSGSEAMLSERRGSKLPLGQYAPAALMLPGSILTPLNSGDAETARTTVRAQKRAGADFIKVGIIEPEVLFATLAEAKKADIPVVGHVPPGVDIVAASRAGMHAIEHLGPGNALLIACSTDKKALLEESRKGSQTPNPPPVKLPFMDEIAEWALLKRIINPAAHEDGPVGLPLVQRTLDSFDETRCRQAARQLKASGSWQVPTLIRAKTTQLADLPEFSNDANLRFMPADTVASWREVTAQFARLYTPAQRALLRENYAANLRLVKLLDEEKVPMLAGSDVSGGWLVPGFSLHQEFAELAKAGLSPLKILQMTTSDAADFCGNSGTMGAVAAGYNADLVILSEDPTENVSNLKAIEGVVRAGYYYGPKAIARLKAGVAEGRGRLR